MQKCGRAGESFLSQASAFNRSVIAFQCMLFHLFLSTDSIYPGRKAPTYFTLHFVPWGVGALLLSNPTHLGAFLSLQCNYLHTPLPWRAEGRGWDELSEERSWVWVLSGAPSAQRGARHTEMFAKGWRTGFLKRSFTVTDFFGRKVYRRTAVGADSWI